MAKSDAPLAQGATVFFSILLVRNHSTRAGAVPLPKDRDECEIAGEGLQLVGCYEDADNDE